MRPGDVMMETCYRVVLVEPLIGKGTSDARGQ